MVPENKKLLFCAKEGEEEKIRTTTGSKTMNVTVASES